MPAGGGDVGRAGQTEHTDSGVSQGGHDLWRVSGAGSGTVLIEGHVADPVELVLGAPVVLDPGCENSWRGVEMVSGGDHVDELDALFVPFRVTVRRIWATCAAPANVIQARRGEHLDRPVCAAAVALLMDWAIRLGDADFAREVYDDLQRQAIGVPERLSNARINIRLSMDRGTAKGRASMFVATVRWEFDVVPQYPIRRFTSLSNADEFRDLRQDNAAQSAWYFRPQLGVNAAAKESFELLNFSVDGKPRTIRRSAKADSQTYSVSMGREVIEASKPVTVAYTYRTILPASRHRLLLRVDQPTKGLSIELDYSDTELADVQIMDFISSSETARITKSPEGIPGKTIGLEFDGWAFPRSGVVFVWR